MEIAMDLEQATHLLEKTKPLKLKEITFKIDSNMTEQKRLFRSSLYKVSIIAEVDNQFYEFSGYDLDQKMISQLENEPSRFLVGAEPPFLCGTNWPDSGISKIVEEENVPLDSLILTDGMKVIATINYNEIFVLIDWLKRLIS